MVSGIGKQADVDLMDMTQLAEYNDGVRFVLLHMISPGMKISPGMLEQYPCIAKLGRKWLKP